MFSHVAYVACPVLCTMLLPVFFCPEIFANVLSCVAQERVAPLHLAADRGDVDSVRVLVGHGANINVKDQVGEDLR
jgi:hypothetical protein